MKHFAQDNHFSGSLWSGMIRYSGLLSFAKRDRQDREKHEARTLGNLCRGLWIGESPVVGGTPIEGGGGAGNYRTSIAV